MLQLSVSRTNLPYLCLFAAAVALSAALFSGIWRPLAAVTAVVAGIFALNILMSLVAARNLQVLLLGWALVYPLGYSVLMIPRTSAILTPDRIAVLCAGSVLILATVHERRSLPVPVPLRKTALLWCGFLLATVISLRALRGQELFGTLRMIIEVFVFPAILALYVLYAFRVRRNLKYLHAVVCIVTIYLAAIAIAEVRAGTDLLPSGENTSEYFAGNGEIHLFRANGPFGSNTTLATVGLINVLFLEFLRRTQREEIVGSRRLLHFAAVTSGCVIALLPMFRALIITATIVFCVAQFRQHRKRAILATVLILATIFALSYGLKVVAPDLYEERVSDSSNFNARVAEYKQAFAIIRDYPLFGVGFNQFYSQVVDRYKYLFLYKGESSLDFPHSTPLAILAETGAFGFILFVAAQISMLRGFRRLLLRSRNAAAAMSWEFVLLIFLAYWGMNIDEASGYYDELNVWCMFVIAIIVKFGIEELHRRSVQSSTVFAARKQVHAL